MRESSLDFSGSLAALGLGFRARRQGRLYEGGSL